MLGGRLRRLALWAVAAPVVPVLAATIVHYARSGATAGSSAVGAGADHGAGAWLSRASTTPVTWPGLVVANGHGWTGPDGLQGTTPAAGSCHFRKSVTGEPLPDPLCTPGAIDPTVTQAKLQSTLCRPGGYTDSVRPPVELTEPVKRKLLAAYGIPAKDIRLYELDHLLELGGAGGASDVRNLWPMPNLFISGTATSSHYIHNDKDQVEAYTRAALCSGRVSLAAVQRATAQDWTTAVARLGLPPIPKGYTG